MEEVFIKASRLKLRFSTNKGLLTVEDLWDLPLQTEKANGVSLDQIALAIHRQIKQSSDEVSFVTEAPKASTELHITFDIVKHIIDAKKVERAAAVAARDKAATKQRILEVLAKKKDEKLEGASEDELLRMLETL